jgi:hypothetical protein
VIARLSHPVAHHAVAETAPLNLPAAASLALHRIAVTQTTGRPGRGRKSRGAQRTAPDAVHRGRPSQASADGALVRLSIVHRSRKKPGKTASIKQALRGACHRKISSQTSTEARPLTHVAPVPLNLATSFQGPAGGLAGLGLRALPVAIDLGRLGAAAPFDSIPRGILAIGVGLLGIGTDHLDPTPDVDLDHAAAVPAKPPQRKLRRGLH